MRSSEVYSVKWNNYTGVLRTLFRRYLKEEKFTDITLTCGSESIQVHRIILCSCSPYFETLLSNGTFPMASNTILFLKDIKPWQLRSLVSYMYNGEVNVQKDHLSELVAAAQSLNIKGLAPDVPEDKIDPDILKSSPSLVPNPRIPNRNPGATELDTLKRKLPQPQNQTQPQFPSSSGIPKLNKIPKLTGNGIGAEGSRQNGSVVGASQRLRSSPGTIKPLPPLQEIKMSPSSKDQSQSAVEIDSDGGGDLNESSVSVDYERAENDPSDADEDIDYPDHKPNLTHNGGASEGGANYIITTSSGVKRRFVSKYSQEVRDSVLAAIHGGMTIRQCSDTYNIPRKTLSKWKNKDNVEVVQAESYPVEEQIVENIEEDETPPEVTKSRRTPSVAYDTQDRAQRLEQALKLTLTGTTVRQAASAYQIPRTTLCAYMKRKGVQKQVAGGGRCIYSVPDSQSDYGTSSSGNNNDSTNEDFPFLGLSSMLMDGMERGDYAEDDDDAYEDL